MTGLETRLELRWISWTEGVSTEMGLLKSYPETRAGSNMMELVPLRTKGRVRTSWDWLEASEVKFLIF